MKAVEDFAEIDDRSFWPSPWNVFSGWERVVVLKLHDRLSRFFKFILQISKPSEGVLESRVLVIWRGRPWN
jgi:hypothetical protein